LVSSPQQSSTVIRTATVLHMATPTYTSTYTSAYRKNEAHSVFDVGVGANNLIVEAIGAVRSQCGTHSTRLSHSPGTPRLPLSSPQSASRTSNTAQPPELLTTNTRNLVATAQDSNVLSSSCGPPSSRAPILNVSKRASDTATHKTPALEAEAIAGHKPWDSSSFWSTS
jgi:hypothetical protein